MLSNLDLIFWGNMALFSSCYLFAFISKHEESHHPKMSLFFPLQCQSLKLRSLSASGFYDLWNLKAFYFSLFLSADSFMSPPVDITQESLLTSQCRIYQIRNLYCSFILHSYLSRGQSCWWHQGWQFCLNHQKCTITFVCWLMRTGYIAHIIHTLYVKKNF